MSASEKPKSLREVLDWIDGSASPEARAAVEAWVLDALVRALELGAEDLQPERGDTPTHAEDVALWKRVAHSIIEGGDV